MDQELEWLKTDLADAQKEIERLQKELEELYANEGKPEPSAPALTALEVLQLQGDVEFLKRRNREVSDLMETEKRLRSAERSNLLRALSLVEIVCKNEEEYLTYFRTVEGKDALKWAHQAYESEMNHFLQSAKGKGV